MIERRALEPRGTGRIPIFALNQTEKLLNDGASAASERKLAARKMVVLAQSGHRHSMDASRKLLSVADRHSVKARF
jgi:hypothetical protein